MLTPDLGSAGGHLEASSPTMRAVVRIVAAVATHDVPVLFRGESGSGKSVLARALHGASPRREGPLVRVDCRALEVEGLATARVLYTALGSAAGGTVLLEEVGGLPKPLQGPVASLIEPTRSAGAGVRVVATSARDLEGAARAGRFSAELLAYLAVVEIRVPPLRERREDILPLAHRFLSAFTPGDAPALELSARAERALLAYAWPGNVRELRNAMQRAVIVSRGAVLDLDALPPRLSAAG
jgi:NtrC-family two-component system response regulator AlgB